MDIRRITDRQNAETVAAVDLRRDEDVVVGGPVTEVEGHGNAGGLRLAGLKREGDGKIGGAPRDRRVVLGAEFAAPLRAGDGRLASQR